MTRGLKSAIGLTSVVAVSAIVWVTVSWAYGAFDDNYQLVGDFPQAGQGLGPGSDVQYRGVQVGEVASIELVDRRARITLNMEPGFQVPENAEVVVRPKTIFGEKFIDMTFPDGPEGPFLEDGDVIENTLSATEVEDFFAASNPLFEEVDHERLAQLVTSMAETVEGEGDQIARSWESGAQASEIGEDTISGQVASLEAFAAFQDAIRATGEDFNTISANTNLASPEFNANQDAFHRVLVELDQFSDRFAELLSESRPDLDTIMVQGDNVVRVLLTREEQISQIVNGLAQYVRTFAEGAGDEVLPDGSRVAFFRVFMYMDGLEDAMCEEMAQAPPEFQPLRDAILGFQDEFDCSDHFSSSAPSGPPSGGSEMSADQLAAIQQEVFDAYYGAVAQPDQPSRQSVEALVENLQEAGQ